MRIIIAGAGDVGSHLAKMLTNENHDIVLIDTNEEKLRNIGSMYDLLTIHGSGSSISVLNDSNIKKADLFIAVTESEEVNITSAILGKKLGAAKTIVRIDNQEYLYPGNKEIFTGLGVDYMIYPEMIAANEVVGLLSQTGTSDIVEFSGGKLFMYVIRLDEDAPIINKTLRDLTEMGMANDYRAVAITRDSHTLIPRGDEKFMLNDHVYVVTGKAGIEDLMKYSGKERFDIHNIMILGGSRIGKRAAKQLGKQHNVKLIELNREKAYQLSNFLSNVLVINGDGSNVDLLMKEGLAQMDAFIAVTGNSETNVISCMLARNIGVKKTIAEVENIDYIKLADSMGIDTIINKKLITASRIFRFTMSSQISSIRCLTGTEAEVMEFNVKPGSRITEAELKEIQFPKDAIIGGVIRGKSSFIARGNTLIKPNDKVVVFALPSAIPKMEKYFN
ncbi:MAG: Trk system potassium transporter TrkA [Bacteroidales bacterium]|nr:Trk system potassium transporter TrkA [Bacteroidales bacterium]